MSDDRQARADWRTRPEGPRDVPGVRRVNLAAFPTAEEADLVDALRADPQAWVDGLSTVVVDDAGTVLGHALLTRCHVGDEPALALAPCAVLPGRQGEGIGAAAVRAGLAAARRIGERFVVVLGHPAYYPRFGFTRASAHGISVTFDAPDEALMVLALRPGDRLPAGVVRYPPAFGG